MKELEQMFEDGSINKFPKKRNHQDGKDIEKKLQNALGGIRDMEGYPQAGFIVDPKKKKKMQ